jgi:hypothetical protein
LEEIGADDGKCDGFSIKTLELPVQTIFIYSRWRWNGICDEYVDVRKRYTRRDLWNSYT